MSKWTHLIRFRAKEDGQVHLGQLVDTTRDAGLDSVGGHEIKAYLINGDAFSGSVTDHVLTVEAVSLLGYPKHSLYWTTLTERLTSFCRPCRGSSVPTSDAWVSTTKTTRR